MPNRTLFLLAAVFALAGASTPAAGTPESGQAASLRSPLRVVSSAQPSLLASLAFASPLASSARSGLPAGVLSRADQVWADAVGDAEAGLAPDLTIIGVVDRSDVVVFGVSYANRRCVGAGDLLAIFVDSDLNPLTGTPTLGAEYALAVDGSTSTVALLRWDGAGFQLVYSPSLRGVCDAGLPGNIIAVDRGELGIASAFTFFVATTFRSGSTTYADVAPDALPGFRYQLAGSPSPPPPPPAPPPAPPAPPPPPPASAPLDASFTVSPKPHRAGETVWFEASDPGHDLYVWDFGDGSSVSGPSPSVTHVYRRAGSYRVTLTVFGAAGSGESARDVEVVPARPDPDKLPTIYGRSARSHKDPEYSRAATRLARGPRAVFCWSQDDWRALMGPKRDVATGFVEYRSPRQVHLAPEICAKLALIRYKRPRPPATLGAAIGLLVFTHEVMHTVGVDNEAAATCFALQLSPLTSRLLGTSFAYGYRLAVLLTRWYSPSRLAPGYWSSECRDGGRLDLDREHTHWP